MTKRKILTVIAAGAAALACVALGFFLRGWVEELGTARPSAGASSQFSTATPLRPEESATTASAKENTQAIPSSSPNRGKSSSGEKQATEAAPIKVPELSAKGLESAKPEASQQASPSTIAMLPAAPKPGSSLPPGSKSVVLEDGFVLLPGGAFQMGSEDGLKYEKPVHSVSVSAFAISPYEVTFREWLAVMGKLPGDLQAKPEQSAELITWFEAVDFCNRESARQGLKPAYAIEGTRVGWDRSANGYRLPTEAEWEYAARAGSASLYSGSDTAREVAVFGTEDSLKPGSLKPNAFGLYDMSGNVAEWCWDWWAPYSEDSLGDPAGPETGQERVFRGGSWYGTERSLTVSSRASTHPSNRQQGLGLRLVRSIFK